MKRDEPQRVIDYLVAELRSVIKAVAVTAAAIVTYALIDAIT